MAPAPTSSQPSSGDVAPAGQPSYAGAHRTFSTKQFLSSAAAASTDPTDAAFARALDEADPFRSMRDMYVLPTSTTPGPASASASTSSSSSSPNAIYLCGNSLGPMSKRTKQALEQELEAWGQKGVLGHWDHPYGRPWTKQEERVSRMMSDIVGAKPSEVTAMSTLTQNLLTMLATFYRPHVSDLVTGAPAPQPPQRFKILYEARAFPSDQYALASAVALAGFDPNEALIPMRPRDGERCLRTEDVVKTIKEDKSIYMVMLAGIQYLTGQWFDIEAITRAGKDEGIIVGWDLAHAFANVPMALHDWNVDFAVWCTYKYGSSGPGGIAGLFVHERWGSIGMKTDLGRCTGASPESKAKGVEGLVRPAGWWGHKKETRFTMPDSFESMDGAAGWQVSNPSMLDIASLLGSLETLALAPGLLDPKLKDVDVGSVEHAQQVEARQGAVGEGLIMPALRTKSLKLTAYMEHLLTRPGVLPEGSNISIVTPTDPRQRGSQLCIRIPDRPQKDAKQSEAVAAAKPTSEKPGEVPPPISAGTLIARAHKRAEREYGLIADVRNPDMLRLAPLAQFSTFEDVRSAVERFAKALNAEM